MDRPGASLLIGQEIAEFTPAMDATPFLMSISAIVVLPLLATA
jgi:hypothetical protein